MISGVRGPVSGTERSASLEVPKGGSEVQPSALKLWIIMARAHQTLTRAVSGRLAEDGLTLAQFGVLEILHHLGPLPLGEIAEKLLVTGGNITYVMDRLEEMGLVYRQRSELDRRVIEARLTPSGSVLMEARFQSHAAFLTRIVGEQLSLAEQETLSRLLKRLGTGIAGAGDFFMLG